MTKDGYPMRVSRDDTEHGVFYYSEKDVMKMLEIARIEERQECAKVLTENAAQCTKGSMNEYILTSNAQAILERGQK
jgi:hypothetical protein